jgi:hypothetical protein
MKRLGGWTAAACWLVLVAACAEPKVRWTGTDIPATDTDAYRAECAHLASERAEQEYALSRPSAGEEFGRQITYRAKVDQYDAAKRRRELYEQCLRDRVGGTVTAPAGEPDAAKEPGAAAKEAGSAKPKPKE